MINELTLRMTQSLENSVETNKKLVVILEKNGWVKAKNGKIPSNTIESFLFDQTNCISGKCEQSKIALYRTEKDVISLSNARKLIKEETHQKSKKRVKYKIKNRSTQKGGYLQNEDIYYHKYLKYKSKYYKEKNK